MTYEKDGSGSLSNYCLGPFRKLMCFFEIRRESSGSGRGMFEDLLNLFQYVDMWPMIKVLRTFSNMDKHMNIFKAPSLNKFFFGINMTFLDIKRTNYCHFEISCNDRRGFTLGFWCHSKSQGFEANSKNKVQLSPLLEICFENFFLLKTFKYYSGQSAK